MDINLINTVLFRRQDVDVVDNIPVINRSNHRNKNNNKYFLKEFINRNTKVM